jgi:hypothetical protein
LIVSSQDDAARKKIDYEKRLGLLEINIKELALRKQLEMDNEILAREKRYI